jgi:hypothetical protein
MTDEERLHMITEQLLLVRDNLFRGMSKSIQKLQARSINEVLELENFTRSPQRTWVGLTDEEIEYAFKTNSVMVDNGNAYMVAGLRAVNIARAIEAAHGIKGEA